jgi:amino acid adenylation domain-containing protein
MPTQETLVESVTLSDAKRRLLAQRLKGAASPALQLERIERRPAGSRTVLGPDQYNLWLDATLHPDEPVYNEIVTVRYAGELDGTLLAQALNLFLARHEGWRTSYRLEGSEVLQIIHPEVHIPPLPLIDLSGLPPSQAEAESNRLATDQARPYLPLDTPPLLRATLVRLAPGDCRLHLTISHLIFDGYSIRRTFLTELATLYASLESGVPHHLPPVELHYADYTNWRHQQLESPHMKAHLEFWKRKLAGDLPLLRLPSDRPRPAAITHRGGIERFTLPGELCDALRRLGKPYRASFYMTLLASFKTLLFRYSGQQDIVIGSVGDGRRRPELEAMMGYMIDVFAVRSQPAASLPFSAYLQQVRQTVIESIGAAEVPFQRVVEALGHKRDLSHSPIFQTLFVLEPPQEPFGKWSIAATEITIGASKYDLYVESDEHADHTNVSIDYSTDLFDQPTIRRMAGHWQTILRAIVANPNTPLGDLPLLAPEERSTLLIGWNDTAKAVPETTLHELVEAQAARTPKAPAVSFAGQTLSYAQLEAEASRIAHHLRLAGAAPETLAAVFLDRSQHLVAALLGILKTGAAYLPLDPGTPAARVALCLEDAAPVVVLTQRSRVADLPPTAAHILVLEDILAAAYPQGFIPTPVSPDALAYVIHTSGSTGRPKGVELRHRGVVNFLLSMQQTPGFTAADTLVAVTTVSFDIAVLELFLPLISGGKVVIASRQTALDPNVLALLIRDSRATVVQATPATWSALLGVDWQGQKGLRVLCGGEALNRSLADRLLELKLELWNMYGPTETTIWSTLHRVEAGNGPIPVGRPIANMTAYILDASLQPVPVNVPGELYLGGVGVARGYRNQPDLTAERFVPSPFRPEETLYRTGDYALYRGDGTLEVQGRADNQVKIRGYRIELEDVEVNLTAHPQVAFAAAKAWPDPAGGHRLCAYLVGVGGPPPSAAELRHFLRGRVADYMIPSEIVALPAMPLTSNGKIDRKRLTEPDRSAAPQLAADSSLTGEELRLAKIWAELLRVDSIAATDNFFDLGGHSLLLLKLNRMINKEFQVDLPMTRIFQAPTIEKLAESIRELTQPVPRASDDWTSLVPLNPRGSRRPLFLIHSLMLYGRLPAALGNDQPFYGLQQLPFDGSGSPAWVDNALEEHIREIKRVQPHGPYQLAGWCFAGFMAYEIARRLEERGEQVSLLALLDSWCPYEAPHASSHGAGTSGVGTSGAGTSRGNSFSSRLRSLLWKVNFRTRQIIRLQPGQRGGHIRRMVRDLVKKASIPAQRKLKSRVYRLCQRWNLPAPAALHDIDVVTYEWLRSYQVRRYRGDITLLRPGDIAVPPGSDPSCGWRDLTSGTIETLFIPGDRSTMFLMPNLALLAEKLHERMK